ncbi:MAG: MauE/DoxX family redox-associated membrane protein [Flavobacteriaceae bacterium]
MWRTVLRIFLALTFFFSAYTKFVGPGFFELTLIDQHIASSRVFAAWLTRLIIGIEVVLGLLLLWKIALRKTLWVVLAMLLVFSLHLGYLWAIGDTENCGCFGELLAMSPAESILKNVGLIIITLLLFPSAKREYFQWKKGFWISALGIGGTFIALPIQKPEAEQFQAFHAFEGASRVDLLSGEKVVAIFNLDCEHCQEAATAMGKLQRQNPDKFPETYVLYFQEGVSTPEDFEGLTQTQYPYLMIEVDTFFDLIGNSPPRLYHLKNGKIAHKIDADFSETLSSIFGLQP